MRAEYSRTLRILLGAAALWCATHAQAAEEKPPVDLIEMLGEMEEDDTGWFENMMYKLEQKGRQPGTPVDDNKAVVGSKPQEAKHAQ